MRGGRGAPRANPAAPPAKGVARKLAISAALSALALAVAPFSWFAWGPTKAFPGQHMVNGLAGVLVGPVWATLVAVVVGTLRIMLGVGTVFAYPGGVPGAAVVGLAYALLRKAGKRGAAAAVAAALTEPLGTVLVGGALAWYLFDPLFAGGSAHAKFGSILWFLAGWALSSVTGSALAAAILSALGRAGVLRLLLGEEG